MSGLTGGPAPILVTGSSGFIGSHLVAALQCAGENVAEISDRANCDMRDLPAVRRRIQSASPRAVVHLAAIPDVAYGDKAQYDIAQTVACTSNLVTALADKPDVLLIHVGSYKQYGDADRPFREDAPTRPQSAYGRAKQVSENIVRGHPTALCLRFGPVYGPGQRSTGLVPTILRSLLDADAELVLSSTPWDPLYVADAVEAVRLSLVTVAAIGQIINVSGGTPVEPSSIFAMLAGELGRDGRFRVARAGETSTAPPVGDISRARRVLGWQPTTSLTSGLRLSIQDLLERLGRSDTSSRQGGTLHGA